MTCAVIFSIAKSVTPLASPEQMPVGAAERRAA